MRQQIVYLQIPDSTRQRHLDWCKQQALDELRFGDCRKVVENAIANIRQHPGTADHPGIEFGYRLILKGFLHTPAEVKHWIEGFN